MCTSDGSGNQAARQQCATPLTSGAYFETGTKSRSYAMSVHRGMLKVEHRQPLKPDGKRPGGIRGAVRGLSPASRKRMIEMMAQIRNIGSMLFVTLTYPDNFPKDSSAWHRHFEAFRDRFEHRYTNWRAIWRIELKDRKSGENTGAIAPHWHLIVFLPFQADTVLNLLADTEQEIMRQMWYEIVASDDPEHRQHGVDVAPVRSIKHAMKYVSKYVAKTCNDWLEIGRRWGRIGRFDTSPSVEVRLTFDEYVAFKRIVKGWMRKRNGKFHRRFARQSPERGCAVFGMGDEAEADWLAFVYEAFRQVAESSARERSYGD